MYIIPLLLSAVLTWSAVSPEINTPPTLACQVYFPNAFSPNDDGVNDEFKPALNSDCAFNSFQLHIYHKSGALMFSSTDGNQGWNGAYRNQPAPAAVYYFIARYTFSDTEAEAPVVITGDLNLLR